MAESAGANRKTGQVVLTPRDRSRSLPSISAMIPEMVRSRLPILSSIRRPGRASAVRQPVPRPPLIPDNERIQELGSSTRSSSTSSRSDSPPPADSLGVLGFGINISDTRSGIDWDTSSTGVRLWLAARTQAANNVNADPALLRTMHIDAIRYMNSALPANLTVSEVRMLSESLPEQIRLQQTTAWQVEGAGNNQRQPKNILRRSVSQTVCMVLALVALFVPYVIQFLNTCLRYERRHHLSERLLANGIIMADVLGEQGLDVKDALIRLGNGRVGASIAGATVWLADGFLGGVTDGLTEVQKPATAGG